MARAVILSAGFALLSVLINTAAGVATGLGWMSIRSHATLAIPASVMALLGWTFVVLYFIHAAAWAKEAVAERGVGSGLADEALAIRRGILPWVQAAVLTLVAAYVVGGGADTGAVSPAIHLGLAVVTLAIHVVAAYRTVVLVGMVLDLERRAEEG